MNSVCAKALVRAPSVMIYAVIGMAWYQITRRDGGGSLSHVARTMIQYTSVAAAASVTV